MRRKSIVLEKATSFSLAIIGLYRNLTEAKEFVISKQLLKSGTAIGANISEALAAESTRDYIIRSRWPLRSRGKPIIGFTYFKKANW